MQDVRLGGQPGPEGFDSFAGKVIAIPLQQCIYSVS